MQNYYSAKYNGFFPDYMFDAYRDAGTLPDDLKPISDESVNEFVAGKQGYVMVAGKDGLPAWQEIPPPTSEELKKQAEDEMQNRIDSAMQSVSVIQLKLQAGRKLTDSETTKLNMVLDYIDALMATDITNAPDIKWPEKPST